MQNGIRGCQGCIHGYVHIYVGTYFRIRRLVQDTGLHTYSRYEVARPPTAAAVVTTAAAAAASVPW